MNHHRGMELIPKARIFEKILRFNSIVFLWEIVLMNMDYI